MQPIIRHDLFTQSVFDSSSLGALAAVIHQFDRPGAYSGKALKGETPAGTFSFVVDEQAEVRQLSIDLSALAADKNAGCAGDEPTPRVVSPKGYVLLYASRGRGYSALVGEGDQREPAFDSRKLGAGDLFTVSLIEPTTYTAEDRIGGGKADITVNLDPERAKNFKHLEPVYVEVQQGSMEPSGIGLVSIQGLVFRIGTDSRIVVQKIGQAPDSDDRKRRVLHRVFRATPSPRP
jgi:hypothetical protein